jgi:hypothetical protein
VRIESLSKVRVAQRVIDIALADQARSMLEPSYVNGMRALHRKLERRLKVD